MTEWAYRTTRPSRGYQPPVYHTDSECHQLIDATEVDKFPIGDAVSLSTLKPCEFCSNSDAGSDRDVTVCPECGNSQIHVRVGGTRSRDSVSTRFRCPRCGETFDDCESRASRKSSERIRGLAGELAEADPDEVSR
jgi:DNA-directed RNA polymerase subunit M/transcription elongation factor TFIIS